MINKIRLYLYVLLFPIKSVNLFKNDVLAEKFSNKKISDIRKLFLDEITPFYNVYSYDELDLTIQRYYSYKLNSTTEDYYLNFMQTINDLTDSFITIRDGFVSYKYWENKNDEKLFGIKESKIKIQIYNYLIRFISMDLFIVNIIVKNYRENEALYKCIPPLDGIYYSINIAEPLLDSILLKGVAENHMHLNSGFDFGISWGLMVNDIFIEKSKINLNTFSSLMGQTEKKMLYYASSLRLLLSIAAKDSVDFEKIDEYHYELKKLKSKIFDGLADHKNIRNEFHKYCEKLLREFNIILPEEEKDILFSVNPELDRLKTSGENILLFKVLYRIHEESYKEKILGMFYDYLRTKNHIYNKIVEHDGIKGLAAFKDYFTNSSKSIKYSAHKRWVELFRSKFQNPHLKKLEGRTAIANEYEKFKKEVYNILYAYKTVIDEDFNKGIDEFPMFGLVFHFQKQADNSSNICWQKYGMNNGKNNECSESYLHYKGIQDKYFFQKNNLINIRKENPYLSYFIIGIDAASQENDTPTNILAPVFKSARDGYQDSLYLVDNEGLKVQQNSLNFTFHAGEDFRHIISGLRRIDEAIEHCKLHSGDRIGHGIALTCDVGRWIHYNPIINIPRIELLENLLWIWGIYCEKAYSNSEIVLYLEREIGKYAGDIYGHTNGLTTTILYKAYLKAFEEIIPNCYSNYICHDNTAAFDQTECENVIFCKMVEEKYAQTWDEYKIALSKHCHCYLEKMREPICLEINEIEKQIINEMQSLMAKKVSQLGIVIEINPTSNSVIGEMDTVYDNHAFILKSINKTVENNVLLCMNTDNPSVFNTTISNEFSFMYYSLIDKGVDKDSALRWIDDVRSIGLSTSFLNNRIGYAQFYNYLCKALENF